jgi:hypothetical protein
MADISAALVELPKAEAIIANVAVVKKRLSKMAKDLRDEIFEEARKAYKKKKLELELSMKMELKRAADESKIALKTAKKLRTIVYEPEGYDSRTKLTDVLWILAKNGYAREADECAGLNRETWTYFPPDMSDEDKDRVRKTNMFWQSIINLEHRMCCHYKCYKVKCNHSAHKTTTRLGWAVRKGQLSRVRELCDWGANIQQPCYSVWKSKSTGWTPLHLACQEKSLDVVRELLDRGANIETVDEEGQTPLMSACWWGPSDIVLELLDRGAKIEAVDNLGRTSLYIASKNGRKDAISELLDRGANIETKSHHDNTPLMAASYEGQVEAVRILLASGANKNYVRPRDGATAAIVAGRAFCVKRSDKAAVLALLA